MDHFYHINNDITLIKMKQVPRQLQSYFELIQKNKDILKDCFTGLYPKNPTDTYPKYIYNKDNDLFAICSKKAGKIIGCMPVFYNKETATISYFLDKDFHNQGIMSDVIKKMIPELFKNNQIKRLIAEVQSQNKQSAHVLKKNFFSQAFIYFSPYEIYVLKREDYFKKELKRLNRETPPLRPRSSKSL